MAIRTASPAGPAPEAARACHVTHPGGDLPAAARGFDYGNHLIAVKLWPRGRLVAGPGPDGGSVATINADGSISAKLGWWRGVEGRLRVTGKRLDATAPPLTADVPGGYEPTGFQPTGLRFPTTGCWKVSGRVSRGHLSFVVRVSKRR